MDKSISVSGYVSLAFEDVMRTFEDAGRVDRLLVPAVGTAFPAESDLQVRATAPERISARSARMKVHWSAVDPFGGDHHGNTALQLLVLQSGNEPLTELLVTMVVDESRSRAVAARLHQVLDELSDRLVLTATDH